jgi:hypothetical protein
MVKCATNCQRFRARSELLQIFRSSSKINSNSSVGTLVMAGSWGNIGIEIEVSRRYAADLWFQLKYPIPPSNPFRTVFLGPGTRTVDDETMIVLT